MPEADSGISGGDLRPGARVDRWEIVSVLSRGPDSTVYAARGGDTGGPTALKEYFPRGISRRDDAGVLIADDREAFDDGLRRFRGEARLLGELDHPGIVAFTGFAEANGTAYLAMAKYDGESLEAVLRDRGPTMSEAAIHAVLASVSDAIDYLHGRGHIHRDIKPGNILIAGNGSAILLDLGAARALGDAPEGGDMSDLTPGYAAPEQHVKGGTEGPWTDIYGLAAVAWRAITGGPPPPAPDRRASGAPMTVTGGFSPGFLDAIEKGLALDLTERPRNVAAWRKLLGTPPRTSPESPAAEPRQADTDHGDYPPTVRVRRTHRNDPPPSAPETRPERAVPGRIRRGGRILRAALVVVALAAIAGGGWWGWRVYDERTRTEWIVDSGGTGHVTTIAAALAKAAPGATLRILPGTYAESLSMAAPVRLIGGGATAADVVIAPANGPCIVMTTERGTVRNLSLRGNGDAPCLDIAAGAPVIEDIVIRNDGGLALRLGGDSRATIRRNTIAGALVIEDSARGDIVDNSIAGGAGSAVRLRGGAEPFFGTNRITSAGQAGILFTGTARGRFVANEITGTNYSGIELRGDSDPTLIGNSISNAGEAGIYVYDGARGTFARNRIFSNAYSGIVIGKGGAPVITENVIRDNRQHGILVLEGGSGRIHGNDVEDNDGNGLVLVTGEAAEIGDNTITGNRDPQTAKGDLGTK